jgi:hypothetical protein
MGCGLNKFPYEKAQEVLISHNAKAKFFFENKINSFQLEDKSSTTRQSRIRKIKEIKLKKKNTLKKDKEPN